MASDLLLTAILPSSSCLQRECPFPSAAGLQQWWAAGAEVAVLTALPVLAERLPALKASSVLGLASPPHLSWKVAESSEELTPQLCASCAALLAQGPSWQEMAAPHCQPGGFRSLLREPCAVLFSSPFPPPSTTPLIHESASQRLELTIHKMLLPRAEPQSGFGSSFEGSFLLHYYSRSCL